MTPSALQPQMVNEELTMDRVRREGGLDAFKLKVLARCSVEHGFLLDVGSGSGKFLFQAKALFLDHAGIEITQECINFAQKELGLNIVYDVSAVKTNLSVVTFWHSLEHIPAEGIERLFARISVLSSQKTRIIISVPNANSLQHRVLREHYAFYDPHTHIHQFTSASLDMLLRKFGFQRCCTVFSFHYSAFGYLQGMLNCFNGIHNYLYYRKKRGLVFGLSRLRLFVYNIYNYFLAGAFLIPSLILSLFDYIFIEKGAVITVCYSREKQ